MTTKPRLVIRLTEEQHKSLSVKAAAAFLCLSTWARKVLLSHRGKD